MTTLNRIAELIAEKLEITTNLEELPHRETMAQLELTLKDLNQKERFRILKLENEYKSFIRTLNSNEIREMYEEDEEETLEGLEETWENIQQESMLLSEDLLEKYEEESDDDSEYGEEDNDDDDNNNDTNKEVENDTETEENEDKDEDEEDEDNEIEDNNRRTALEEEQESVKQQKKVISPEEEKKLIIQKIDTVLKKTGGKISRQDLIKITGMNIEGNEVRVKALGIKLVASLLNRDLFVAKKL